MKKLNAALTVLAAAAALATTGMASAQGLTRAEVQAQLAQAQADGTLNALDGQDSGSAYLSQHFHPTVPRSEVKAELAQAQANGTLNVLDGQDSGSVYLAEHHGEPPSDNNAMATASLAGQ